MMMMMMCVVYRLGFFELLFVAVMLECVVGLEIIRIVSLANFERYHLEGPSTWSSNVPNVPGVVPVMRMRMRMILVVVVMVMLV